MQQQHENREHLAFKVTAAPFAVTLTYLVCVLIFQVLLPLGPGVSECFRTSQQLPCKLWWKLWQFGNKPKQSQGFWFKTVLVTDFTQRQLSNLKESPPISRRIHISHATGCCITYNVCLTSHEKALYSPWKESTVWRGWDYVNVWISSFDTKIGWNFSWQVKLKDQPVVGVQDAWKLEDTQFHIHIQSFSITH